MTDLASLVEAIVDDLVEQGKPVRFSGGAATVHVTAGPLRRVIDNLVTNALRHAGDASVGIVSGPADVRVIVDDHGPGIPRAHQRRIFEKFYRIDDSITSGVEGSGIGLALCRQIAELHDGTIRYESGRGGGSTFIIELPLAN